jgi:hypothetical protein
MITCRILASTVGELVTGHKDWDDGIIPPVEIDRTKIKK